MIPDSDGYGVYINNLMAVRLFPSDGRYRSRGDGSAMWSYDCRPLGWVDDGVYRVECVTAALLVRGQLTPHWQQVPKGLLLIHPQYTLSVKQTSKGWVPSISDELGRSHTLKARATNIQAVKLLEDLLRRRVGREKPFFETQPWLDPSDDLGQRPQFRLGLGLIATDIAALIRNDHVESAQWTGERLASAMTLAKLLNYSIRCGLDELPRLATILATYIKFALIDIYSGANSVVLAGRTLTFTSEELLAFRDRFRRCPMTDEEYLDFVNKHFVSPLRGLRRRHRVPKSSILGLRLLRPRRDRGDFPFELPGPTGIRLFEVMRSRRGRKKG